MNIKEFMTDARHNTHLERLLYDALQELERIRGVLFERAMTVKEAAEKIQKKLTNENIIDITLNTCGELQVAPPCDHAVMEFMNQRDHVKKLIVAVEREQAEAKG